MQPAGSPPWRVIETPPTSGTTPSAPADGDGATSPPVRGVTVDGRVLATIGATAACALVAFLLAFGSGGGTTVVDGGVAIGPDPSATAAIGLSGGVVVVEIEGAIARPGVYRLQTGARIVDLVKAAGGYGPRVDIARAERDLNLAATLADGDQIRVPSRDDEVVTEGPAATDGDAGVGGGGGLVSLNRATGAQLEALPGIGPATAAKIIAAREEAPFVVVEDLRTRGILGEKTFGKLRDLVTP